MSHPKLATTSFSVPSKTFLLGEYAVLSGCPAVIANTTPRFSLLMTHYTEQHTNDYVNINKQGAIKLLCEHIEKDCHGFRFTFIDPYNGAGGFGASSAQYALLYAAHKQLTQQHFEPKICLNHYLQDYRNTSAASLQPSGADIVAQCYGQLTVFNPEKQHCDQLTWPWNDIHCVFLRTQHKVPTHQHLANLSTFPTQALAECSLAGINALQQANKQNFIDAVYTTARQLEKANLTHHLTISLLKQLADCPFVLAAKGCGALGADVITTVVSTNDLPLFKTWLDNSPLNYISDTRYLTDGLMHEDLATQRAS